MQTILGAGGVVGRELAGSLKSYTDEIRLVSRNPVKVNDSDILFRADLTSREDVIKAVEGSDVAYLTAGINYSTREWQEKWPVIMRNVIEACKINGTRLVFFDNIYLYDPSNLDPITENNNVNPKSKKGKVRSLIAGMVTDEVEKGNLTALIARAPDFYGPGIKGASILTETVFNNLSSGKKANWLGSVNYKHSFIYTPDAGKATAILGNTPDAWNQVWHLPTAPDPLTGKEWIYSIARELGVEPKYQVAPKFMVRVLGLFTPIMKEMVEMMYQYEQDYVFDSSRFEKRFGFEPTPYLDGIKNIVKTDYGR